VTSEKTRVIDWLFFNRKFDAKTGVLVEPVVTADDINEGIAATRARLKLGGNRMNFWKDLTRGGAKSLNRNWPEKVFASGFTGRDAIGQAPGAVFMFLPVAADQKSPFEDDESFDDQLPIIPLQSLSMPQTMKALGRSGENWHAQVADRLNVVSSFFALCSPRNRAPRSVAEVNFLQTGIRMKGGETDAAFRLLADDGQWLVSAEVKGKREQFNYAQIARSSSGLEHSIRRKELSTLGDVAGVIPLGIKVIGRSTLWLVEFEPVPHSTSPLVKVAEGLFQLVPHVPGIE